MNLNPAFLSSGDMIICTNTDNTGNGISNLLAIRMNGQNWTQVIPNADYASWR